MQSSRVMKKERNQCASYTSPLPPCKICGAKASGLHYGVNTCEACKGFFRRAIKFQRKYRCFQQQNCDVTGGRSIRTSCPFCRLQKCLNMGMAHNAIKTGRYTHAKRTENIMEVKRLESVSKETCYPEYGLTGRKQMSVDCGIHPMSGQFQVTNASYVKSEPYSEDFLNVHIKQESGNEINFPKTFIHQGLQKIESLKLDVSNDFDPLLNQVQSEQFKSELTRLLVNELQIQIDSVMSVPSNTTDLLSQCHQELNQKNTGENAIETKTGNETPISASHETQEIMSETESEGVYISIPTPPLSSCSSGDDSGFEFSTGSYEQAHIVVVSSSSSPTKDTVHQNAISSPLLTDSSSFFTPATSPLLDPLDSVPSPASTRSTFFMSDYVFAPIESLTMTPESVNDFESQTKGTTFFHSLSQVVQEDVASVIEILLSAHRKHVFTLAEYDGHFIQDKQQEFVEKHRVQAEIFGLSSHYLKDEIYKEIFDHTGLDVDGRQELLFTAATYMSTYLQSLMKFATSIPGFTNLLPEDQFTLIASAKREQWFLNAYLGINKEQSVIVMPNLQVYSFRELSLLLGPELAEKSFTIAPYFQKFDFPYEVMVIWKAVLLLSTDHVDLLEPKKVTELQNVYVNCLLVLTNRMKEERPRLFPHLINLMLHLRELDHVSMTPLSMNENNLDLKVKSHYMKAFS